MREEKNVTSHNLRIEQRILHIMFYVRGPQTFLAEFSGKLLKFPIFLIIVITVETIAMTIALELSLRAGPRLQY